jgi:phosphoribosylamine--glycine ligase
MAVVVLGTGGREHALAWKLAQHADKVYVIPGNPGMALGNPKIVPCDVDLGIQEFSNFCQSNSVELVVVGPETLIETGVADVLAMNEIPCFAPTRKAARLESSKVFAKKFMESHGIATPDFQCFSDVEEAKLFLAAKEAEFGRFVLKADGLCAGKGVLIPKDTEEARQGLDDLLSAKKFGTASQSVVVERFHAGVEASFFALCDGTDSLLLPSIQDYKRRENGGQGLNTGGMGARCPGMWSLSEARQEEVRKHVEELILPKTIKGLSNLGTPFVGLLYMGLMITEDEVLMLEYNCRFGDPETQVLLPLLQFDLVACMRACVSGRLAAFKSGLAGNLHSGYSCGVVLVSPGYPGPPEDGELIDQAKPTSAQVQLFYSGCAQTDDRLLSKGGRILTVVGTADHPDQARALVYAEIEANPRFANAQYRTDIGIF